MSVIRALKLGFGRNSRLCTYVNPYSYIFFRKNLSLFEPFRIKIDGIALVFLLRISGVGRVLRKSFDFTSEAKIVFENAITNKKSVYLIGSVEKHIARAASVITTAYPELNVCGVRSGFFDSNFTKKEAINDIVSCAPDIVVCGMGTPTQEIFLKELAENGWLGQGYTCGGFFHQTSEGRVDYYPRFFDFLNIRWLYRILKEPHLLKRYAIFYPYSACLFIFDVCKYFFCREYK